jgi:TolB-like protein
MTTYTPGQRVEWLHEPRGGYGYARWVLATVVRVTRRRIVIDAQLVGGGTKRIAVDPARLRTTP